MASKVTARGYAAASLDKFMGWYLGLSPERSSYTVQPTSIPMTDGVNLAADLYQPILLRGITEAFPVILVYGCYGRSGPQAILAARIYAARGHPVLYVSTRGTFGSGGTFDPGRAETSDSQDIVTWMRKQPWYKGTFATCGASYLGMSQWSLLEDPPSDCIASAIIVGPHDYAQYHWGTGSFRLDRIQWSELVVHQEDSVSIGRRIISALTTKPVDFGSVLRSLPLADGVDRHFAGKAPWLTKSMRLPDTTDSYWEVLKHQRALERTTTPILLVAGWYDIFATQTFDQYARLLERGCQVSLTVGPWTHIEAALGAASDAMLFLDKHVGLSEASSQDSSARIYVTGAEEWRVIPSWPPSTTPQQLFLHGRVLDVMEPVSDPPSSSFTYNPADPTPTIGGSEVSKGGRVDDSAYASRSDLLVYTGSIISEDTEILGKPAVQLKHSSDIPFVDLFVRLSEVDTAGISHNICDTLQALDPARNPDAPVQLTLPDCAHRFRKGTRIRLVIAGGSFPAYARNLGTSEVRTQGDKMRASCHTIQHAQGVSRLTLPIRS